MVREFTLPDVGEGVAEGELLEWHVAVGDTVTEDQVVAEVETDKAVVDVPSPVNGTVRELRAEPGDVVPVGDVIITFDVEGEDAPEEDAAGGDAETGVSADAGATDGTDAGAADTAGDGEAAGDSADAGAAEAGPSGNGHAGGRVFAPPSARKLARELGVDITTVEGSGPGGRVTDSDVRAAAEGMSDDTGGETELESAVRRIGDDEGDGASAAGDGETASEGAGAVGPEAAASSVATGGTGAGGAATPEAAGRERTLAAPATRKVARDLDVDIDDVPADEGRDGEAFVTEAAVREYATAQQRTQAADTAAMAGAETAGEAAAADAAVTGERERREPYRGVRKTIGEAMERSKFTAPHVTHHDTVDVTALVAAREKLKPRAEQQGVRLAYLPFVMKAVVAALKDHPVLNTSLDEENGEIVYKNYYDIGVATATDAGLMVPVVEGVDGKGLVEIAGDVNELTTKARDRSIARDELRGSTFTITNFGTIGGEYATPIINYPETAILGLGAIKERPWVHEGEVVPRKVLTLSLSVDHRVVDGADAARFVNTLKEYLEDPALLLLE